MGGGFHFVVHFLSHESVPEFLDVEVLAVLDLRLIFAVVGGLLGNLLILLDTLHSLLDGFLLVFKTFSNLSQNSIGISMFLLNVLHKTVHGILGLKTLLFYSSVLHALHFEDGNLILESLIILGGLNLEREEILLHSFKDVMVRGIGVLLLVDFSLSGFNRIIKHR